MTFQFLGLAEKFGSGIFPYAEVSLPEKKERWVLYWNDI